MNPLKKTIRVKAMIESASANAEILHSMALAMTKDDIAMLESHIVQCLEGAVKVIKCEHP